MVLSKRGPRPDADLCSSAAADGYPRANGRSRAYSAANIHADTRANVRAYIRADTQTNGYSHN